MMRMALQPEEEVGIDQEQPEVEVEEEEEKTPETNFLKVKLHKVEVVEVAEVAEVAEVDNKPEVEEKHLKEPHTKEPEHQDKIIDVKLTRPHTNGDSSMKKDQLTKRSQLPRTPLSRNYHLSPILSKNHLKKNSIEK